MEKETHFPEDNVKHREEMVMKLLKNYITKSWDVNFPTYLTTLYFSNFVELEYTKGVSK